MGKLITQDDTLCRFTHLNKLHKALTKRVQQSYRYRFTDFLDRGVKSCASKERLNNRALSTDNTKFFLYKIFTIISKVVTDSEF